MTLLVQDFLGACVAGYVGNRADYLACNSMRDVVERLRAGGPPINGELQRAVRKAYIEATIILLEVRLGQLGVEPTPMGKCLERLCIRPSLVGRNRDHVQATNRAEVQWLEDVQQAYRDELCRLPHAVMADETPDTARQIADMLAPRDKAMAKQRAADLKGQLEENLLAELRTHFSFDLSYPSWGLVACIKDGWDIPPPDGTSASRDKALPSSAGAPTSVAIPALEGAPAPEAGPIGAGAPAPMVNSVPGTRKPAHTDWFDLMCACFAHEYKTNDKLRSLFEGQMLADLQVAGTPLAQALQAQLASQGKEILVRLDQLREPLDTYLDLTREIKDTVTSTRATAEQTRDTVEHAQQTLDAVKNTTERTYDLVRRLQTGQRVSDEEALAAARQLLTKMPLDAVPDPAPLPPGSWVDLRPNRLFLGRDTELRAMARTFQGGGAVAAVSGLGGMGKTQLACEFAWRYGPYFAGGVYWLSFDRAADVPALVAACGGPGHMDLRPGSDFGNLSLKEQGELVRAAWDGPLPRLLIFDNCEDEKVLNDWMPGPGGSRVLVTSRRGEWDPSLGLTVLPLGTLSPADSIALLRVPLRYVGRALPPAADPDLAALALELDGLPLALHLAGSFLARYRDEITPAAYLAQLHGPRLLKHRSLQRSEGLAPTKHDLDVGRTFALSYDRLNPHDPRDAQARALLARAARFAPGNVIPRPLLLAALPVVDDDPDATLMRADALRRLIELGLVEREGAVNEGVRLHRLLALFVNGAITDGEACEASAAVDEVLLKEARRLIDVGLPGELLLLQPHLRAATDAALTEANERADRLCLVLGRALEKLAAYRQAQGYVERALAIRERTLPPDHPDVAWAVTCLATVLRDQGEYARARPLYERALAIRERSPPPDHPNITQSLNNLASVLSDQGEYARARPLYERALAIQERSPPPDHPDLAWTLNNLASVLSDQGEYARARPLYERALAIQERSLQSVHPYTAIVRHNLDVLPPSDG